MLQIFEKWISNFSESKNVDQSIQSNKIGEKMKDINFLIGNNSYYFFFKKGLICRV